MISAMVSRDRISFSPLRHCQGCSGLKERIIGNKVPLSSESDHAESNEGKDKNELGTFLIIIYLQASEEKYVVQGTIY